MENSDLIMCVHCTGIRIPSISYILCHSKSSKEGIIFGQCLA